MTFEEFINQKKLNDGKHFSPFSEEEHSVFKFKFSSVPNQDGHVVKNIIVSQHISLNYVYNNNSFFVSSRNEPTLFPWFLLYLSNNSQLINKIYFDKLDEHLSPHLILENQLRENGVTEQIFKIRKLLFSQLEVHDFFSKLKVASTGCKITLNEEINPQMLDFLKIEINSLPNYIIINSDEQKMLSMSQFNTQYFKYIYQNITLTQFLNDHNVREVILNARIYSKNNNSTINNKKKI